ncbi:CCA tRNA nucleotidyltransferase 1, mitochondrial [Strongyloides ratti]|uniref:CCA tRNA nucleotidyltransferase 1, mitochondrial n=1 Tax=Strongyloides ratti TaxID=34506 RepID=A0A090L578_STRRB|nr:CCA tRNA nucleotidyltransferase 1, mitochondrial [Strongyloides ratti]CEF63237.1 CCA tRNA nucleotidyltransferase 1, mitochondrial [Strongyloides ratti]
MMEMEYMKPIIPKTKHIDSKNFKELFTPELVKLSELFKNNGFEIRIAGGAVRDLLLGNKPVDVDFASDATPQQMIEMFNRENIRMLNKRGEEHGTVTCRIDDKENFEVTTLRIDVVCDGRRAEVMFTKNWQLDAFRRDLTINALFLKLDGTVIDYTNGIEDLENRKVVFAGDAETRIQEDYLRILRYFRFYGRIAENPNAFDEKTLDAIKKNASGLGGISGERIWTEFKKIILGRFSSSIIKVMLEECKLNKYLGIPENCSLDHYVKIVTMNNINDLMPSTIISSLFSNMDDLDKFHNRCKISNAERGLCESIINVRDFLNEKLKNDSVSRFKIWKDLLTDEYYKNCMKNEEAAKERVKQIGMYLLCEKELLNEINQIKIPYFPLNGVVLMKNNFPKGPKVKFILDNCFTEWVESDYTMSLDDLIAFGKKLEIPENINQKKNRKRKSS